MREYSITIPVVEKQESDLTEQEALLVTEAKAATLRSYSPFSHFSVGAAVLLADGTIVSGSNQENSSFPAGTCAERTAVFYANSRYPDQPVRAICVAARDSSGQFTQLPVTPCGSCRQVLSQVEERYGQPVRVLLYGTSGIHIMESIRGLLPLHFDSTYLK